MFDFLPADEKKLAAWFQAFVDKLKGIWSTLGLSDNQVKSLEQDSAAFTELVRGEETVRSTATSSTVRDDIIKYKTLLKEGPSPALQQAFPTLFTPLITGTAPGIVLRLLDFVHNLKEKPEYTGAIGETLDILPPAGTDATGYLPKGDNELNGWFRTFVNHLKDRQTTLKLSNAEIAGLERDQNALEHLVTELDRAINDRKATQHFKDLVDFKNFMKFGAPEEARVAFPALFTPTLLSIVPGILPRLMNFLTRLKDLPGFNPSVATLLGMVPVAATAGATEPASVPVPPPTVPLRTPPPTSMPLRKDEARTGWLIPGVLGALGLVLAWWLLGRPNQTADIPPTPPTARGVRVASLAPMDLATAVKDRKEQDILVLYERGAADWLMPIVEEFNNKQGDKGRILLATLGSREGRDQILYDKQQYEPDVWIPADRYWVDKLRRDATDQKVSGKSGATVAEGKPLLQTYLVLGMRDDRAKIFEAAMADKYKGHTWKLLSDIATKGWSAIGGPAEWGKLKLAQSNPLQSNSGMVALSLMYNEFHRDNPTKDLNSKEFEDFMQSIQGAVPNFTDTTSESLTAFLDDPTKFDAVVAYESDVIRELDAGKTGFKVLYPAPTAAIVLPITTVEGKWVTAPEKNMSQQFESMVLNDAAQEKAMTSGYRPVNSSLQTKVAETFGAASRLAAGIVATPDTTGSETDSKTKEGLIYNWDQSQSQ